MFLAPWCDNAAAEAEVKAQSKYTIRCFPSGGPVHLMPLVPGGEGREEEGGRGNEHLQALAQGRACFYSGKPATHMALFARAF